MTKYDESIFRQDEPEPLPFEDKVVIWFCMILYIVMLFAGYLEGQ